jgi:hypothetical protein
MLYNTGVLLYTSKQRPDATPALCAAGIPREERTMPARGRPSLGTESICVSLKREQIEQLRAEAAAQQTYVSDLVREAIRRFFSPTKTSDVEQKTTEVGQ